MSGVRFSLLAADDASACLMSGKDKYLSHLYVLRSRCCKEDTIRHIVSRERLDALIDIIGTLFVAVETYNGEVGFDKSGLDSSDAQRRVCEVDTQSVGEHLDSSLGCTIDRTVGISRISSHTADIDNMPVIACHHTGYYKARDIEQRLDVGVNHSVPVGKVAFVLFFESECESCVIDEDVDVLPFSRQISNLFLRFLPVAHVKDKQQGLRSVLLLEVVSKLPERLLAACIEDESIAVGGEFLCACHSYS